MFHFFLFKFIIAELTRSLFFSYYTAFNALKGEGNMKRRVLERLVVKLKKPFMLLMPSHFLQTKTLRNFINKHGNFQFIIPTQKVYFYHLDNKGEKLDYGKNYEIPLFYTMW